MRALPGIRRCGIDGILADARLGRGRRKVSGKMRIVPMFHNTLINMPSTIDLGTGARLLGDIVFLRVK